MRTVTITIGLVILVLCFAGIAQADTVWDSGYHQILASETYGEVWMYNDCTLDIFGGNIFRLAAYDTTYTNWYSGKMIELWALGSSIVNLYGGSLNRFDSDQNGELNLYAYDVVYHTTGGYWDGGWVEGRYLNDNSYFDFDIPGQETISHINIVPEPTAFLLLGVGSILFRKKK